MSRRDSKGERANLKNAYIEGAGVVKNETITTTLEKNYMPYAMSVILSRALPQIDGFKPSHRKLLYTMYKMGLLNGKLTKSANIVGATMKLNPHGDSAIYETMVRLSRGYEALLYPFVESKGNFGKFYSRDMAYAASRYTEAKLAPICEELFSDIDKDSVDFVPNYDNTTKEPLLLPIRFPSVLVNSNVGIAVSMASSICPFNLAEVCSATIKIIKGENFKLLDVLKGPDFPGGGFLIKDEPALLKIYETGKGTFKVRSRYVVDKENNCIDITQIPYTTTVEAIIDKVVGLIKSNKVREIADIRDETDLNGLKITIDLKRNVNPKNLMNKLFKYTPLQDSYACNFNILVDGVPKVMGVKDIIKSWQHFRQLCVKRRTKFELSKKQNKLHLVEGLNKILLDIDKAIEIIRNTEKEDKVIENLMNGFNIDVVQAEYVSEIKLKCLNRQYILNRVMEKDQLEKDILNLQNILSSDSIINNIICVELENIIKKYGQSRKTMFLHSVEDYIDSEEPENLDYPVNLFITNDGYLKKITAQSLKLSREQKLKECDFVKMHAELQNDTDLLFFTNKARMFKANLANFKETKASSLGDFIPAALKFDAEENVLEVVYTKDYDGNLLFFYENGKVAKVALSCYKTNRKKLLKAFCADSPLVAIYKEQDFKYYIIIATNEKCVVGSSGLLEVKFKKDSKGVLFIKLNKGACVRKVQGLHEEDVKDYSAFLCNKIPSAGKYLGEQLNLF